jgi:hypothetical protein
MPSTALSRALSKGSVRIELNKNNKLSVLAERIKPRARGKALPTNRRCFELFERFFTGANQLICRDKKAVS